MEMDDELKIPADASLPIDTRIRLETTTDTPIYVNKDTCQREAGRSLLIGRQAATADIRIQHGSISRKHAALYVKDGKIFLIDFGGKHGTTVNGQRVEGTKELADGDTILFGNASDSTFKITIMDAATLDAPGNILTGRAKRQAEINAMTASLDVAPTYQKVNAGASTGDLSDKQRKRAKKFRIPVSDCLQIESESDRRSSARCLAVDPAGARFAVGSMDNFLRLYDFGGMDQIRQESFKVVIPEDGHPVLACCYSNTGDKMIVSTGGVQPVVLDRNGEEIVKFVRGDMYVTDQTKTYGHTATVTAVDWHPMDRDVVLTGSADGSARLWNLNGKRHFDDLVCEKVFPVKNDKGQRVGVSSVRFHPGGKEFAVGTEHGSIQIFNTSRASGRPERSCSDCHGEGKSIDSLAYDAGGTVLVSRSVADGTCKVWNHLRLSRSGSPLVTCKGLKSESSERCQVAVNADGSILCAGTVEITPRGEDGQVEAGKLHFFRIKPAKSDVLDPLLTIDIGERHALDIKWHPNLEQIFCSCSDGQVLIYFDRDLSSKGACRVLERKGKSGDALSELLRSKARADPTIMTGQVVAPFAGDPSRKRKSEVLEPERPATGKHHDVDRPGGSSTLQQYVAAKYLVKNSEVAGKDPREALLKYKSEQDEKETRVLSERTFEEEEGNEQQ